MIEVELIRKFDRCYPLRIWGCVIFINSVLQLNTESN